MDILIGHCKFVRKYDKPNNGHLINVKNFHQESIYDL